MAKGGEQRQERRSRKKPKLLHTLGRWQELLVDFAQFQSLNYNWLHSLPALRCVAWVKQLLQHPSSVITTVVLHKSRANTCMASVLNNLNTNMNGNNERAICGTFFRGSRKKSRSWKESFAFAVYWYFTWLLAEYGKSELGLLGLQILSIRISIYFAL